MIPVIALVPMVSLVLAVSGGAVGAQMPEVAGTDTVTVTPEGRYRAGGPHRWLLGSNNRHLWEMPLRVAVLDMTRFAGGLTPLRRGGGLQTRSLRMRGLDGQVYNFRSIDKDASRSLDPVLLGSVAAEVLQDQISALLPLSALVVAPLLDAANVLHADPLLVVMPDVAALGEFREEFAGLLGLLEIRPDEGPDGEPGFAGSNRVTGSPRLLKRLEENSRNYVDPTAFLKARLMDFFVGDWDRHPDQWRWAAFEEGSRTRWEPIPRDRDWALAHIGGLLPWAAGFAWPHYTGFSYDYPSAFRAGWSGRALDRRLFSGMSREAWDPVVTELERSLTDDVIFDAVNQLPPEYRNLIGVELRRALINRRNDLRRMAGEFYELLAGWVDVRATDKEDLALIDRLPSGAVRVRLANADGGPTAPTPYFDRTFFADETREVRIYLHGDDDSATIRGPGAPGGPILVRIIGGGGDDLLIDESPSGESRFYDHRGQNSFRVGPGTQVDESDYEVPDDPASKTHQASPRDWGAYWIPLPSLTFDPDRGLYLGFGAIRYGYGFRHFPFKNRLSFSLGFTTQSLDARASIDWLRSLRDSGARLHLRASYSGAEVDRFYGFGNETKEDREERFFKAEQREMELNADLQLVLDPGITLAVGPFFKGVRPLRDPRRLIDQNPPYGRSNFEEAGLSLSAVWDARNRAVAASKGAIVAVDGRLVPAVLDAEETFAILAGEAAVFLSSTRGIEPTLALRVGGKKIWGRFPHFEAAFLGGNVNLRGFVRDRFAGDASLFGNTEFRILVGDFNLLMPMDYGVFALGDVGRVYVDGASPAGWHTSAGGGVWLSVLDRRNTMSFHVARSEERNGVYVQAGFLF